MNDPTEQALCALCQQLHARRRPATVRAIVPMAGERPRYWLCDDCMADVGAYTEGLVEVL